LNKVAPFSYNRKIITFELQKTEIEEQKRIWSRGRGRDSLYTSSKGLLIHFLFSLGKWKFNKLNGFGWEKL
jgi:hypothetical protein